jgi:hypothetical protein
LASLKKGQGYGPEFLKLKKLILNSATLTNFWEYRLVTVNTPFQSAFSARMISFTSRICQKNKI